MSEAFDRSKGWSEAKDGGKGSSEAVDCSEDLCKDINGSEGTGEAIDGSWGLSEAAIVGARGSHEAIDGSKGLKEGQSEDIDDGKGLIRATEGILGTSKAIDGWTSLREAIGGREGLCEATDGRLGLSGAAIIDSQVVCSYENKEGEEDEKWDEHFKSDTGPFKDNRGEEDEKQEQQDFDMVDGEQRLVAELATIHECPYENPRVAAWVEQVKNSDRHAKEWILRSLVAFKDKGVRPAGFEFLDNEGEGLLELAIQGLRD